MNHHRHALLGAVAAVALGSAGGADAQDNASVRVARISTVEEVIVTAQRRAESVVNVPISITVASAKQLEQAGIDKLEDIGRISPAVQMGLLGISVQPSIRGVTSSLAGTSFENNVGVYVDGVYQPNNRGLNLDLANIRSVQVLKGPQGTLFGRNSTGGALLIDTLDPDMTKTVGRISGGYFRFNDFRGQVYLSTPITSNLAINVAGYYRKSDGYLRNVTGFDAAPLSSSSISTKIRWEPTAELALQLKYDHVYSSDARGTANTSLKCVASAGAPCPVSGTRNAFVFANPGTYVETRDYKTALSFAPKMTAELDTASLKGSYDFGPARLNGLVSYQYTTDKTTSDRDYVVPFAPNSETTSTTTTQVYTGDFNVTSTTSGPIQYVVGLFYYKTRNPTGAYLINPNSSLTIRQLNTLETKAYAAYADVTWEVVPNLFLTGGIRFNDEKTTNIVRSGTLVILNNPAINPAFRQTTKFNNTSPRVVVRYALDEHSNVYGSVTRGARSGTVATSTPFNEIRPEKITAYEIGYKTQQDRFRFDSSAYYYDFKDLQVSGSIIDPITHLPLPLTTNADSAEIYGGEFQLSGELARNLNASLGVAYTHARYKKFPGASVNGISPVTGLNLTACANPTPPPVTVACTQDFSGKVLTRAPEWTANLSADYTMESSVGDFILSGNLAYSSKYIPTRDDLYPNGTYRYQASGYTLLNMKLAWNPAMHPNLTVSAVAQNLTDERYVTYFSGNAADDFLSLGAPRTWGVQLDYRF